MQLITASAVAPAIGPYSHAVRDGNYLFCSGQLPIRADGELVKGGISDQAHRVFENILRVLEVGGASLHDVVKTTVFMTDLAEFGELNRIYEEYFGTHRPARTTIQVARLPLGANVEIEVVARNFSN